MPEKSNFQIVKKALGEITANAIRGLAREEAESVVRGLRQEVVSLVGQQERNIEVAEADGSSEAAKVANEGTAAVVAAEQVVEEAKADPSPERVEAAVEAVEEAKEKVEEVKSDLDQRVADIEETLAPWRKGEKLGDRKPSRFDPLEQDMARLTGQVDQAESRLEEAKTVYEKAVSLIRASNQPALWIVAFVTFVVMLVISGIFAIFTPLTFFWDAVWISVATMAFVTIVMWILEYGIPMLGKRRKSKSQARPAWDNDELSIMEDKEEQGASAH